MYDHIHYGFSELKHYGDILYDTQIVIESVKYCSRIQYKISHKA